MKIDFKKLVKNYELDALETLKENIRIPSVYDETSISKDAPYGKGVANCFEFLKRLALKDGFDVDTCDGRCLEVSCGSGKNLIYIFAHQDVVPVTGVWSTEPFGAEIRDNRMYGRGTSDDKGPGISAYYALKALKDNNLIDDYRVRLVFGGDEERGSSCLEYYFNVLKKEDPTYGFTPDGDFPLIFAEKGICNYKYESKINFENIISIDAGVVSNAVIDKATVVVKNPQILDKYLKDHSTIKYTKENKNTYVFLGKSAHGSLPELGINSGIIMLKALGEAYSENTLKILASEYADSWGRNMNVFYENEKLGVTTYNVGLINYKDGVFSMVVNFRYPSGVNKDEIISKIQDVSPFPVIEMSHAVPLYFDPDSTPFIKELLKVYKDETGIEGKPLAIGGGTYAKEAKNTVAFGSKFEGKEDNIHSIDEKIDLEDFYSSMSIYAHAIYSLGKLK